ncbi:S53 family peptidase [Tardisphaera miroshnichenkoae]
MYFRGIAVLVLFLLGGSGVVFLASASPTYSGPQVSYYAEPLFLPQQGSGGLIHLGFPYPEGSPPYTPSQIAEYYGFNEVAGRGEGQTIVIVDAFGSPTIYHDVAVFDAVFDLPPVSMRVIRLPGPSNSTLSDREGWALETSLDVEWAHAMAPYANIVLLEASSDSVPALYYAVQYAVVHRLGNVISMSWGLPEPYEAAVTGPGSVSSFDSVFSLAAREGIALVASSGDEGAFNGLAFPNVNFPASDPYVLAVGGTNLTLSTSQYGTAAENGEVIASTAEYAWANSGGGVSEIFSEPSWQSDAQIEVTTTQGTSIPTGRAVPDVSYVAMSPYGATGLAGLWIYDSTPYVIEEGAGQPAIVISGWYGVGGTSCGAPQWSALIADAESAGSPSGAHAVMFQQLISGKIIAPLIYEQSANQAEYFKPIGVYGQLNNNGYYYASEDWDAITGWGSPNAEAVAQLLSS